MDEIETVVIGGGQAGLAMSYHLQALGLEHVVFERAGVAERWRSQRWDSLMFQFPNWSIELPGYSYVTENPDGFASKDQVRRFLQDYTVRIKAPLRTQTNVTALRRRSSGVRFEVTTDEGSVIARNVVVATGPYQRPRRPSCADALPPGVAQLHAGDYRNPQSLPRGAVLVVGSGASGCQIADELLQSGRTVYLSLGRHRRVPRRYRGRDAFWWRRELGELDATVDAMPAGQRKAAPLVTGVNGGYDIDLRRSAAEGMMLLGRLLDCSDAKLRFAQDADDLVRAGDDMFRDFVAAADALVLQAGLVVEPAPAPIPAIHDQRPIKSQGQLDIKGAGVTAVIWATGYQLDFGWIELPVFDGRGVPLHHRGASEAPGLYFLGLQWLYKAKSSFLCGVGEDAAYVAARIAADVH